MAVPVFCEDEVVGTGGWRPSENRLGLAGSNRSEYLRNHRDWLSKIGRLQNRRNRIAANRS